MKLEVWQFSELDANDLTLFYYSLFSLIYNEKYDYRYRYSNRIIINFTSQKKKTEYSYYPYLPVSA